MKREKAIIVIWCLVVASVFLTICSRSSFLYPINDWNDAQSFFTVGKSMVHGKVMYRDLFEHKGPYLYLIYGIASLFSQSSFLGVYIMEIVFLTIFLYFSVQTMTLFCKKESAIMLLPLLAYGVCSSKSFSWGGSAEEFVLPFFAIGLYDAMRYMKLGEVPDKQVIFINGIFAGVIALIKYTMLGFHFAWMLMILMVLTCKKEWKNALKYGVIFLIGMCMAAIPWFIYFGTNNALDDWYHCYIHTNLFLYGGNMLSGGIGQKIYDWAKILYWDIVVNWMYFIPLIIGMVGILVWRKTSWYAKIQLYLLFGFMFMLIYFGDAELFYYPLPFATFAAVGLGMLGKLGDKLWSKRNKLHIMGMTCVLVISTVGGYVTSTNIPYMHKEQDELFLYKMKGIIEKEENPTLLNYNMIDAGLYTVTGIIPTCRFFHRPNVAHEEMIQVQEQFVAEGKTMFVLTKDTYPSSVEEKYQLVAKEPYEHYGTEIIYYLFKLKE